MKTSAASLWVGFKIKIMTKQEFEELSNFPVEMVTNTPYEAKSSNVTVLKLEKGETFVAYGKRTVGKDDYSIVDQFGHLHYFDSCDLLYKD